MTSPRLHTGANDPPARHPPTKRPSAYASATRTLRLERKRQDVECGACMSVCPSTHGQATQRNPCAHAQVRQSARRRKVSLAASAGPHASGRLVGSLSPTRVEYGSRWARPGEATHATRGRGGVSGDMMDVASLAFGAPVPPPHHTLAQTRNKRVTPAQDSNMLKLAVFQISS